MGKKADEKIIKEVLLKVNKEAKTDDNNEISKINDSVLKENVIKKFFGTKKAKARIGSAFVYEIIGDQEVFDGVYPLLKGGVKDFGGDYTVIDYKGTIKYLTTPDPRDYTPCYTKVKKILHVVKLADDDFRIKKRLNDEYYREVEIPKTIEVPVKNEAGEVVGYDEREAIDEKGMPVFEVVKEHYHRPAAITQEGREAIKEGNEYKKRMAELKRKEENWFKKNFVAIASYGVLMMLIFAVMFTSDRMIESFSEIREDIYEDNQNTRNYLSTGLVDKLADKVEQKQIEKDNPPS